jgi:formate dehydrogenase assembly factor FdhD
MTKVVVLNPKDDHKMVTGYCYNCDSKLEAYCLEQLETCDNCESNNIKVDKTTEFIKRYCEYDIQTACNIATGDDETTGKEVIRVLKTITKKEKEKTNV